jgi:hypothetical protein
VLISGKVFGVNYPILAIPAILAISSYGPLPASFSQTPTGHRRFVDNKHQTPIRPSGDRAVEALFSRVSHAQLRIFRTAAYSVFKDHPPDTLPSNGQCGTLPFVRFVVKHNMFANLGLFPIFGHIWLVQTSLLSGIVRKTKTNSFGRLAGQFNQ